MQVLGSIAIFTFFHLSFPFILFWFTVEYLNTAFVIAIKLVFSLSVNNKNDPAESYLRLIKDLSLNRFVIKTINLLSRDMGEGMRQVSLLSLEQISTRQHDNNDMHSENRYLRANGWDDLRG